MGQAEQFVSDYQGASLRGSTAPSTIEVTYDLVLRKVDWFDQVYSDLTNLDKVDSDAHEEFVSRMRDNGYPVYRIVVMTRPVSLQDAIPVVSMHSPATDQGTGPLTTAMALGLSSAAVVLLLAACLLTRLVWQKRHDLARGNE